MVFPESDPGFDQLTQYLCGADLEDLLRDGPRLGALIPELGDELGFDQHSPHHAYDLYTHTAHVTAAVPGIPVLRWAALLHDVGKVPVFTLDAGGRGHFCGHGPAGAVLAGSILDRLNAPPALRRETVLLIRLHMDRVRPDRESLQLLLNRYGPEFLDRLLTLQEADMRSKGTCEHEGETAFRDIRAMLALPDPKKESAMYPV